MQIVVVADSCDDDTAAIARSYSRRAPISVVATSVGQAGAARRIGSSVAAHLARTPSERHWIASTDADTVVPPDWLTRQLTLAADGVAGVAGIAQLSRVRDNRHRELAAAFARHYVLAPDGSHDHVHGANLGVRADALFAVGGWSLLATGEDECLWARLRSGGYRLVSTTGLVVRTSPRLAGRAPQGFAGVLAGLATHGAPA